MPIKTGKLDIIDLCNMSFLIRKDFCKIKGKSKFFLLSPEHNSFVYILETILYVKKVGSQDYQNVFYFFKKDNFSEPNYFY